MLGYLYFAVWAEVDSTRQHEKLSSTEMISSHYVKASSSWEAVSPYTLYSALTLNQVDAEHESDNNHQDTWHNPVVVLQPVDDGNTSPVKITLEGEAGIHLTAVNIVSNAKHMEIYDSRGEYLMTVRGQKEEDGQEMLYRKCLTFESSLPACSLKLLSLASKGCLKLYSLQTSVRRVDPVPTHGPKRQIDMVKVREMLSSMSAPVPENVQHLMQTVEQYQENQSSVWSDIQQQVADSAVKNTSTAPMAGLLSMLARANDMSRLAGRESTDSNTVTDAMSKMMSSVCGGQVAGQTSGEDLYNSLRGICRNVSQMRVDEKREMRKGREDEEEMGEKESAGMEKELQPPLGDPKTAEKLERRLVAQLEALEERMMGRLERRLDAIETHLELRLNRIEAIVENLSQKCVDRQKRSENLARRENQGNILQGLADAKEDELDVSREETTSGTRFDDSVSDTGQSS